MIRTLLRSGRLSPRDPLSEEQLAAVLGASRNAVRKALQQLADEGIVVRQPKIGTRLAHELVHIDGGQVVPRGMTLGQAAGRMSIIQTRSEPVVLTPVVRAKLETSETQGVLSESRFYLDDEPLSLRVGYVTGDVAAVRAALESFDIVNPPPYEEAFCHLYGAELGSSQSTFEAIRCEPRTASVLGIAEGSPVLLAETVVRDVDAVARELSYTYYRGDRVSVSSVTRARSA